MHKKCLKRQLLALVFNTPNATEAPTFSHHRRIRCKNDFGGPKAILHNVNIILPAIFWYILYPWRVRYIYHMRYKYYNYYKASWQLHSTLRCSTRDLLSATGDLSRLWNIDFFVLGVYALYLSGPYSTRWCRISGSCDLRLRKKLVLVFLACKDGLGCPNLETHLPCQRHGIRNRAWREVPLRLGHCAP